VENKLLKFILEKRHHQYRRDFTCDLASEYKNRGLSPEERMSDRFLRLLAAETPVILPDERICFLRTVKNIPDCFTEDEWKEIKKEHFVHELG
jgi:formate C-acetyltransferase